MEIVKASVNPFPPETNSEIERVSSNTILPNKDYRQFQQKKRLSLILLGII
jgi:hypothetical protein